MYQQHMERFFLGFLLMFLVLNCSSSTKETKHSPLELSISMEKSSYSLKEPIFMKVKLTNIGNDTLKVAPLIMGLGYLRFTIINEKGDTLPYIGEWIEGNFPDVVLAPGEELNTVMDGHTKEVKKLDLLTAYNITKKGKYKVKGVYTGYGRVESNTESFTIK